MDDLEFVQKCIKGDKRSWDEFVDRYSRLIYSYIHSVLRLYPQQYLPQDHASDIFQEIFVLLSRDNFKKLGSFKAKNGSSLASWLRQVVINYTIDCLRKARPVISLDADTGDGRALADTLPAEGVSVPEIAQQKEEARHLSECIEVLELDDKLFLELYLNQDLGLQELAGALKVSRGTIDMRKHRIVERLKECFKSKGHALDF